MTIWGNTLETSPEKWEILVQFGLAMTRSEAEELRFPKRHCTQLEQLLVQNHKLVNHGHQFDCAAFWSSSEKCRDTVYRKIYFPFFTSDFLTNFLRSDFNRSSFTRKKHALIVALSPEIRATNIVS